LQDQNEIFDTEDFPVWLLLHDRPAAAAVPSRFHIAPTRLWERLAAAMGLRGASLVLLSRLQISPTGQAGWNKLSGFTNSH
jgi:hypothetical protein